MNREEAIFCDAIEIADPEQRDQFVANQCGDDQQLRQQVNQLLQMHDGHQRVLDETTDGSAVNSSFAVMPAVGERIGNYKLLQEIGDGGMGVVYMAEQTEPVRRKVAIKIIKVGMDTRSVVARFESERQAMALMDHPCITKVLDAGATESGRPYFVMELVHGKSVTQYCDEKRLPLEQRLELFTQICNAVEHAHQKGIIHRDIKPTNIMVTNVDGRPLPKIIDFGIAKATAEPLTDKTMFTHYGQMIGTPLYMSPEQAEMSDPDIDTRSDIYSLGVVLYELLTGTTPLHHLKKEGIQEIRDAIRSGEPQLASTRINTLGDTSEQISRDRDTDIRSLHRLIRGELDWIVMKCLATDRNDRYQSAGELAKDIERFIEGEPIEAAAPTVMYRTRKFVARNKLAVAIAALFAAILAGATIISSSLAYQANQLAKRASSAEQLANDRLQEVVKERDRAQAAERQLEALERRQRNQLAIQRAASLHNNAIFKEYLAGDESLDNRPNRKKFIARPMSTVWQRNRPEPPAPPADAQVDSFGSKTESLNSMHQVPTQIIISDQHLDEALQSIEVFVGEGDVMDQALLENILHSQQSLFGEDDVIVVSTLKKLGELAAEEKNWDDSERYYRRALNIVQDVALDQPQVSEIRLHLANALENKGDPEKAVAELKAIQDTLENVDMKRELRIIFEKVKDEITRLESEDDK